MKPQITPTPRLLRTRDAAAYLATSPWKVRRLAQDGLIPYVEDAEGSPWRFDRKDLDAYIEQHKEGSHA